MGSCLLYFLDHSLVPQLGLIIHALTSQHPKQLVNPCYQLVSYDTFDMVLKVLHGVTPHHTIICSPPLAFCLVGDPAFICHRSPPLTPSL